MLPYKKRLGPPDMTWMYEPMVDIGEYTAIQLAVFNGKYYLAERSRRRYKNKTGTEKESVYKKWVLPISINRDGEKSKPPWSKTKCLQVPIGNDLETAITILDFFLNELKKRREDGKIEETSGVCESGGQHSPEGGCESGECRCDSSECEQESESCLERTESTSKQG